MMPLDEIVRRGVRNQPDVGALASRDGDKVVIMTWHYHDDDLSGPPALVELSVTGLPVGPREASLQHFRIDEQHSNAFSVWKAMGSPQNPTAAQYAELENAGQLTLLSPAPPVPLENGRATVKFSLPRQGVSLLEFTWVDK